MARSLTVLVPMTRKQSSAVRDALGVFLSTEDNYGRIGGKDEEFVRQVRDEIRRQRQMARWERS